MEARQRYRPWAVSSHSSTRLSVARQRRYTVTSKELSCFSFKFFFSDCSLHSLTDVIRLNPTITVRIKHSDVNSSLTPAGIQTLVYIYFFPSVFSRVWSLAEFDLKCGSKTGSKQRKHYALPSGIIHVAYDLIIELPRSTDIMTKQRFSFKRRAIT